MPSPPKQPTHFEVYGNNLLCADSNYASMNLEQFNKASKTYDTILRAYNDPVLCAGKGANYKNEITVNLSKSDFMSGTAYPENAILKASCEELDATVRNYGAKMADSSKKVSEKLVNDRQEYNDNSKKVIDNYNDVISKRSKLDENVKRLLGYDNTIMYEKQNILDSTIYTTILWTVLATSILYYAFTKL